MILNICLQQAAQALPKMYQDGSRWSQMMQDGSRMAQAVTQIAQVGAGTGRFITPPLTFVFMRASKLYAQVYEAFIWVAWLEGIMNTENNPWLP